MVIPGLTALTMTPEAIGRIANSRTRYMSRSFEVLYVSSIEKLLGLFRASRSGPEVFRHLNDAVY